MLVVIHKELTDFSHQLFGNILDIGDAGVNVTLLFHGHQTVIACLLPIVLLLALDRADQTALDHAPRKSRLVHQDQHVDRIAIRRAAFQAGSSFAQPGLRRNNMPTSVFEKHRETLEQHEPSLSDREIRDQRWAPSLTSICTQRADGVDWQSYRARGPAGGCGRPCG